MACAREELASARSTSHWHRGLVVASYFGFVVGAILLLTIIVGSCAALIVLLYYVAHLFMYLFGLSFRWGLVASCGLLFVGCGIGGLIHDLRLTVMPAEAAERQTTLPPAPAGSSLSEAGS
jgi:hypothetical protein